MATPATLNLRLEVGQVTEQINVEADLAPTLNTFDATVGHPFVEREVKSLPFLARNPVNLLTLRPGVVFTGESDTDLLFQGSIARLDKREGAVNGVRGNQTNITVDGTNASDWQNQAAFTSGWREIIGVASDVKHTGLVAEATPEMYAPTLRNATGVYDLVVRSAATPAQLISAVRGQIRELDPNLPLFTVRTLEEVIALNLARQRFAVALLGAFAVIGLLLAAVGVYSVMAYSVSLRTREMGVRMALGAQSGDVLRMVLREGLKLTAIGVAIGLLVALALTQLMKNLLYGVGAADPLTFTGVPLLPTVVAMIACWLPARRAAKTDPMAALRSE